MHITKYKYSISQMLFGTILLWFLLILSYIEIITDKSGYKSWLVFGLIALIIACRMIYLAVMYYIPCLLGKTAIELDSAKLQFFIKGKLLFQVARPVAYWKDIDNIHYISAPRYRSIISFKMKDGDTFGISTKYIAGDGKVIYNSIIEYFEKNR